MQWIEKSDPASDLSVEAAVIRWCAGRLPVPEVLAVEDGVLAMSALPGVNLTEAAMECAVALTAEALHLIHSVPTEGCPFRADWVTRLHQAEHRVRCGLVDEGDFDEVKAALSKVLPSATRFRRVGLITFGPGPYNQCNVQLNFAPMPNAADSIMRVVDALTPAGKTPLTTAVEQAAEVLD
jgi:hypothetical protein